MLAGTQASCLGAGLWGDGTSVSVGLGHGGSLRSGVRLPERGRGYVVPERWKRRRFLHGVGELVGLVQRVGRGLRLSDPRAVLGVADLSRVGGGESSWHRSHQSGRDVDLLFFNRRDNGRPFPPPEHDLVAFDGLGMPVAPLTGPGYATSDWAERRFDERRNWALVEALLSDPGARVQRIFVSDPLRARLLRHAERAGRPRWLVDYGRQVMTQPGDDIPHDDHFHVRIYCPRGDRFYGCVDTGPVWHHEKKAFKYAGTERYDPLLWKLLTYLPPALPR